MEMERLELQDIVAQDKNGIVYAAWDSVLGRKVAIRRFLPFGQGGGGLENEEAAAFEIAAKRLSKIQHEALRTIMYGGVDPIDSIPFLVTEWVDGATLKTVLADEAMDPALVIDVLRIALELSIVLSHVLGEEAVWIETQSESIVVGDQESGRGFTFWISPFKWLGADFESRKLSSIVALGEDLTGWKKKLVGDQAGYGLGGWLKWLRNNPDASLHEALESLSASTGKEPPAPEETLVQQATRPVIPQFKQASSKTPIILTATVALLVTGMVLFYLHKTAKAPEFPADYTEQEISETIVDATPDRKPKPAAAVLEPKDDATARVNALAEKLSREAGEKSKTEAEESIVSDALLKAQRELAESRGGILSPEQYELARTFKTGDPAKIRGIVRGIRTSGSKKTIYLNFSDPHDTNLTNGLVHQSDFKGNYGMETFEKYVGKQVTINGTIFIESPKKSYHVKITSMDQISTGE